VCVCVCVCLVCSAVLFQDLPCVITAKKNAFDSFAINLNKAAAETSDGEPRPPRMSDAARIPQRCGAVPCRALPYRCWTSACMYVRPRVEALSPRSWGGDWLFLASPPLNVCCTAAGIPRHLIFLFYSCLRLTFAPARALEQSDARERLPDDAGHQRDGGGFFGRLIAESRRGAARLLLPVPGQGRAPAGGRGRDADDRQETEPVSAPHPQISCMLSERGV